MMRWNSTRTYTEEDILKMQQEAVSRVHEFQSRAAPQPVYDVPEADIRLIESRDVPPLSITPAELAAAAVTGEPPLQSPLPSAPSPASEQPPAPVQQSPSTANDPLRGILGKLNLDNETLLILALMFLLYNENVDNTLLLALGYLLL